MAGLSTVMLASFSGGTVYSAELPSPLVYLADIDASVLQDIRYAGYNNFTGAPAPGYDAPECILTREAARALARVQGALAKQQYALIVYDCYRPIRAVKSFVRWVSVGESTAQTKTYMPNVAKRSLIEAGYIAPRSTHSTGQAIDITIVPIKRGPHAAAEDTQGQAAADCTRPETARGSDGSVDMGTSYDCFDVKSHTNAARLTVVQKAARRLLVNAMKAHGFSNYAKEWWHFTFSGGASQSYDVPVSARATKPMPDEVVPAVSADPEPIKE